MYWLLLLSFCPNSIIGVPLCIFHAHGAFIIYLIIFPAIEKYRSVAKTFFWELAVFPSILHSDTSFAWKLKTQEREHFDNFSSRCDNGSKRIKFTASSKLLLIPQERNLDESVYGHTTTGGKRWYVLGNDLY